MEIMLWLEYIREKDTIAAPPSAPRLLAERKKHLPGPSAAVDVHLKCHAHAGSMEALCPWGWVLLSSELCPHGAIAVPAPWGRGRAAPGVFSKQSRQKCSTRAQIMAQGGSVPFLPTASARIGHGAGGHSEVAPWGQQEGGTAIAVLSPLWGDERGVLPVPVHGFGVCSVAEGSGGTQGTPHPPEMKMTEEKRATPI